MSPTDLRHVDLVLVCEICEGDVDLSESSETAVCRHCGIAFAVDAAPLAERRRA